MANLVRVRVELNPKEDDRDVGFRKLLMAFRGACTDAGIMHTYKQHQAYESESRKKRRRVRENHINRIKTKLKENFWANQGKKHE